MGVPANTGCSRLGYLAPIQLLHPHFSSLSSKGAHAATAKRLNRTVGSDACGLGPNAPITRMHGRPLARPNKTLHGGRRISRAKGNNV